MLSTVTTAARPPQDTVLFSAKAPSASTYTLELTTHGPVWMIFRLRVLFGGELAPTWGFYDLKTPRRFLPAPAYAQKDLTAAIIVADVEPHRLGGLILTNFMMPRHSPSPPRMLEKTSPPPSSSRTSSRTDSVPRPEDALTSPPPLRLLKKTSPPPSLSRTSSSHLLARYLRMPTCPRVSGSGYHSRHRWPELAPPSPPTLRSFFFRRRRALPPERGGRAQMYVTSPRPARGPEHAAASGDCAAHASPAVCQNFHHHSPGSRSIRRTPSPSPRTRRTPGSLGAPLSSSTTAGSVGDSAFGAPVTNSAKIDFFLPMPDAPLSSFSTGGDDENAVGVHTTLVAFTLSIIVVFVYFFLHHNAKKAEFIVKRAAQPFAREGPGSCYNVACAKNTDIKLYRRRVITGSQLLERLVWKVGHTNDIERRQGEYGSRILIVLSERFAQLQQLCDGGNLVIEPCPGCKRRHREYYDFRSVGGFKAFTALMNKVITTMGEVPSSVSTLHLLVNLSAHLAYILASALFFFFGIFFAQAVRSVRAPPPPARPQRRHEERGNR
ncbi:hypothetical protein B0H11DRAFT_1933015, partial [Mycena galericulata]